jgi:hypothetical protein
MAGAADLMAESYYSAATRAIRPKAKPNSICRVDCLRETPVCFP